MCPRSRRHIRGAMAHLRNTTAVWGGSCMGIFRLYSGNDGESHIEELDLASHPDLTALHGAKGVVFRSTAPGHFSDWHNAQRASGGNTSSPCRASEKSAWGMALSTAWGREP